MLLSGFQTSLSTRISCMLMHRDETCHIEMFSCSDREVATFSQFSVQFDGAVKNMAKMAADQTTKVRTNQKPAL